MPSSSRRLSARRITRRRRLPQRPPYRASLNSTGKPLHFVSGSGERPDNGNVTAVEETEIVPGSTAQTFRTEFEFDAINRRTKQSVIDRTLSTNKMVTQLWC